MTKKLIFIWLLLSAVLLFGTMYHPNTALVKTTVQREITRGKFDLQEFDNYMERYKVTEVKSVTKKAENQYYLIYTSEPIDFEELETKKFSGIEYIQPNYMNRMHAIPNDPLYYQQLMENVNLPRAWNYATGNNDITIAIIDSGLHFDHPDLQQNVWYNELEIADSGIDNDNNGYIDDWRGWDFVDAPEWEAIAFGDYIVPDNEPFDDNNHGTHIAGIIGATTNNNEGVAGICWNVKLMILRAGFNTASGGYLQDDDASAALMYAADMGADVISLSWGDNNYSPIIADACQYAYQKGSIIVAAAGNDGVAPIVYPARLSTTISVGAVDKDDKLATFSSYGPNLDLVAPGVSIISTFDVNAENLYQIQSGTSMSVPFVAGAIGLLLSEEPDLSFEGVKSRLAFSCKDLGDNYGYDIEFGYGLLDVYGLLNQNNAPLVKIDYPTDYETFSEPFPINGSVLVPDFKYYTIMYTTEIEPNETDWKNITNHLNTPDFYYEEVENGLLGTFNVTEVSNEYLQYKIRVRAYDKSHRKYEYKRTIIIDKSAPVFYPERSGFEKRYDKENVVYYVQTVYNEPVSQLLQLSDGANSYQIHSARIDSIHVAKLPENIADGTYEINCYAENEAGLTTNATLPFEANLKFYSLDINQFEQVDLDKMLFMSRDYADFNGNGKYEFLGYETIDGANVLHMFEVDNDSLHITHTFTNYITPRAIGNTNSARLEMLGVVGDTGFLFEAPSADSIYPTKQVYAWNVTFGADFLDYDGDGISDVALVKNENPTSANRVVQIFKRQGSNFNELITIRNLSSGVPEKNIFVPKVVAGNFNGNSIPDVLTADQEGDIMLFESGELAWMRRSPVPNTFFLGKGKFTNSQNEHDDFCVGGYLYNPDNSALNLAYFEFFTFDANSQTYKKIGYVSFDNVAVRNSIAIADITGDGTAEIICDVPPSIYIVDFTDSDGDGSYEFAPIWVGDSASELQNTIVALPFSATQPAHIVANREVNGELKSNIIRKREANYSLQAPELYQVHPLNESSVMISWKENPNAEYYKLYRMYNEQDEFISDVFGTSHIDTGLIAGETYSYGVSSYHSAENPAESLPTMWKSVIPFYPPKIVSAKMISGSEIELIFNRQLNTDAINITNYSLNNDFGFPHSVNWTQSHNGVILNFQKLLPNPSSIDSFEEYQLTINQLFGHTGVPFQDANFPNNIIPISFQEDVHAPYILRAEKTAERSVAIFFNEALSQTSAETEEFYHLTLPSADSNNQIEAIQYSSQQGNFTVTITLQNKPILTNQQYFLKILHVEDLAGNPISNNGNKITFSLNDISKLTQHVVAPNPFETKLHPEIRFFLPVEEAGKISIYDLSGALVFEDSFQPLTRLRNFYSWNGRNMTNQRVSSGLYLYVIKMGNEIVKGKIAVIN